MSKFTIKHGFTLIEFSVVIVIIGLLIAGITIGMNVVRQSEMHSVISDMHAYQIAYSSFVKRYHAVPGDMNNASSYFSTCATTNSNCNGNGDGLISFNNGLPDESYSAWKQLALSDLINAAIEQIPDSWSGSEAVGSTLPASEIASAGYIIAGAAKYFGQDNSSNTVSSGWSDGTTNAVFIGKISYLGLGNSALRPEEAFNIDTKIDDGAINSSSFVGAQSGKFRTINGLDSGNNCLSSGNYNTSNQQILCISGYALN